MVLKEKSVIIVAIMVLKEKTICFYVLYMMNACIWLALFLSSK